jgi:hypothetical protein
MGPPTVDPLQGTPFRWLQGPLNCTPYWGPPTWESVQGSSHRLSQTGDPLHRTRYRGPLQGHDKGDHIHGTSHLQNSGPSRLAQIVVTHRCDRHSSLHESKPIRRTTCKVLETGDPVQVTPYRGPHLGSHYRGPPKCPHAGDPLQVICYRDPYTVPPSRYSLQENPYRGPPTAYPLNGTP